MVLHLSPILFTALLLSSVPVLAESAAVSAQAKVDFNHHIRPIISAKCFHCHGPDEESRKAKLRLDHREEALKDRDGFRAIVPGDLDASELILRITSHDKDEVMPPPKEGDALTAAEIDLLKRWIAQGAEYQEHWAWSRPALPPVPAATDAKATIRNPVDAFISNAANRAGLRQSPEADRHTLLRRLSLDLIGLPPTPEEVAAFVGDAAPDAYEKAVDHLLASPHFGEKWARMWLDLARYADSTGYGSDKFRLNIWPYRDWVIDAFNRNLPYDQFTIEQLAGDLLPNATPEQIAATAFHRNTMTNVEGGTIDEEFRVAAVKDRVATTTQVWTGLTFQCAQCHTHKFDPISHAEYYQLYAIFNQTEDSDREDEAPTMPFPTEDEKTRRDAVQREIAALEARLNADSPELEAEQHAWEAQMAAPVEWTVLEPEQMSAEGGVQLTRRPDGAVLATGDAATNTYRIQVRTKLEGITAFRLEALPDPSLPGQGPGRSDQGNAVLSELRITAEPVAAPPVRGRFIRVEAPGRNRMLSLAEVQVFQGDVNLASKGMATQSSTDFEGPAQLAIDGKTDGNFRAGSVTHTAQSENPWWEVDLGTEQEIDRIVIWNRTDGGLQERLANSRVRVLDAARKTLAELPIETAPNPQAELSARGLRTVKLRHASADFSQETWDVEKAIDGISDKKGGWAFAPQFGQAHVAAFETAEPVGQGETLLTFRLEQQFGGNHTLGCFRISATTKAGSVRVLPPEIRQILALEPTERSDEQRHTAARFFRAGAEGLAGVRAELTQKRAALAKIKPVAIPILRELPPAKQRPTHILSKGNYLTPSDPVQPALPATFTEGFPAPERTDRLALAKWLVDPSNPLTARVTVNRFWSHLFGTGLVESEEDFGTQGTLPTHPELLDWLAVTFQTPATAPQPGLGWDVKALLKVLVTSATYRQSSKVDPGDLEKDSRNRWLARFPRRRLDAEQVRDQALALSGLLSRKLGGPSVYPPQPDGLWNVAFNGGQNGYPTSQGEDRYRRGLYTFWRRTMPYPSMSTFDAPSRETCTIRRQPTNTPLQAFVTLNDPCFVESAQVLARRVLREGGTDQTERLRWALQLVLARPAREEQLTTLRQLLDTELAGFRDDAAAATKLAASEKQPLPAGADAAELAAWTVVANVLLNLDGVLTKS